MSLVPLSVSLSTLFISFTYVYVVNKSIETSVNNKICLWFLFSIIHVICPYVSFSQTMEVPKLHAHCVLLIPDSARTLCPTGSRQCTHIVSYWSKTMYAHYVLGVRPIYTLCDTRAMNSMRTLCHLGHTHCTSHVIF